MRDSPVGLRLGEPEHDSGQTRTQEGGATPIQLACVGPAGVRFEHARREENRGAGDRNVDHEDPLPGGVVDDQTADDRTEDRPEKNRHPNRGQGTPDPPRSGALRDQGETDWHQHPAAEALKDPEPDQFTGRGRQRAQS
jgi:hypothetical protein